MKVNKSNIDFFYALNQFIKNIEKEDKDKESQKKLYDEAWDSLEDGMKSKTEALLDLIIEGKIKHIKWSPDGE